MVEFSCPWCESKVVLAPSANDEGECPECLTTWQYEDEDVELALAA